MKRLSVKSQFRLGTGLILLVVCIATALLVYSVGKKQVEADIHKAAEKIRAAGLPVYFAERLLLGK